MEMTEEDTIGDGLAPDQHGAFSYWQVLKIRAALCDHALYGDDGRGLSDARLASEISAWAELKASADARAAGEADPEIDITIGKEAIRRFRNASYLDPRTGRIKEPESIGWIAYYLTHPDIGALSLEELRRRKLPYLAPLRLAEFLDPDPVPIPERLNGIYRTEARRDNLLITKHISILVPDDGVLMHVEEIENHFEIPSRGQPRFLRQYEKTGWGLLTPEDYILIFLKNDRRARNAYYFSFFQVDDFWARETIDHLFVCEQSDIHELPADLADLTRADTQRRADSRSQVKTKYLGYLRDAVGSGFLLFDRTAQFSLQEKEVLSNINTSIDIDTEPDVGLPRVGTERTGEVIGSLLQALGAGQDNPNRDDSVNEEEWQRRGRRLLQAADTGDPARVQAALDAGASVNYADPRNGETALHIVAAGRARLALRVLMRQSDLKYSVRDRSGRLPSEIANLTIDAAMGRLLMLKEAEEGRRENILPRRRADVAIPSLEP